MVRIAVVRCAVVLRQNDGYEVIRGAGVIVCKLSIYIGNLVSELELRIVILMIEYNVLVIEMVV